MFLRATTRKKDGKEHRYWSVVENRRVAGGRVIQRHVLYLGEINSSQELAWRKSIEVIEEGSVQPRSLAPDLSLSLLKLVNTAAVGAKTRIMSLNHAITVLGRTALKRWVQVLLFVGGKRGVEFPSPLLVFAASRGRLMELMAEKLLNRDRGLQEKAFLVGMLSLMNAHFGISLAELLRHLPVAKDVSAALLKQSGQLGSMLGLTELLDIPNFMYSQFSLVEIGQIEPSAVLNLQMEAMRWANSLGDGIP